MALLVVMMTVDGFARIKAMVGVVAKYAFGRPCRND